MLERRYNGLSIPITVFEFGTYVMAQLDFILVNVSFMAFGFAWQTSAVSELRVYHY